MGEIKASGYESTTYNRLSEKNLYFKVTDDRGREICPYTVPRPSDDSGHASRYAAEEMKEWQESGLGEAIRPQRRSLSEFGKVVPYRFAEGGTTSLSPGLDVDKNGYARFPPGAWASSVPSVLAPYVEKVTLYDVIDPHRAGVGTGSRREMIPAPVPAGAQIPPAGFQVLRGYLFDKPGKYRMTAIYQQERFVERIYPRFEALPAWAKELLRSLARVGIRLYPETRYRMKISARSPEVALEVLP